ncbi:acetoacetate--CoA ligase [Parvibaculum sp.]|uniref:acetoacetate--CoA ligase n=1 Tax=Parvibaculum sp. TaxID=2024848 RepID=UPI003BAACD02
MANMGDLLWTPSREMVSDANITAFTAWLNERGHDFKNYEDVRRWSADDIEGFWGAIWQYFDVTSSTPYDCVMRGSRMPGAEWFPGSRVNYIRALLSKGDGEKTAIHAAGEAGPARKISWAELQDQVFKLATSMRELGIKPGDRVVSYMPNIPEAAVAFFATASIGAVWSSCSPDFGSASVIDRFGQITPKLMFVTDSYRYGGKDFDRRTEVRAMADALPSLQHVVHVKGSSPAFNSEAVVEGAHAWETLVNRAPVKDFEFEDTAFDHPLWIVYSSGTTGLPKPFVHGHGGVLLEALKFTHFHLNLKPSSCMFYFTTTGWVMWNILLSGLVAGSAVVLYDGNPVAPKADRLWELAAETGMTLFGASPTFLNGQMKAGIHPNKLYDMSKMKSILLGGSPVMPEHMEWCFENLQSDIWVTSQSGGTDVASAFVGGMPTLPVHAGEIQTRCLGVDVQAFDDEGKSVTGEVGELVVCKPMPSMPLYFWNDEGGHRYHDSYFDTYEGHWRHGDYFKVNERGGCFILGRSDSTLNRFGVRIGTAEIYRTIEGLEEIEDSIIVNLDLPGGNFFMPLFVVMQKGEALTDEVKTKINKALREKYSPRHVPDRIYEIDAVPYTLTGKKMEVPVRKILLGAALEKAASRDAMANPDAIDYFVRFAKMQTEYKTAAA